MSILSHDIESLPLTLVELLSCPELHSILRLVLKAGNYMNAVSHAFLQFCLLSFPLTNKALSILLSVHNAPVTGGGLGMCPGTSLSQCTCFVVLKV